MADIRLAKPAAGTTQTVPSAPDGRFIFDFPADAATLTRNGDDLVLTFEDGAAIQLQGFYTTYSKEEMPSFQVDGVEISGQDFFAALDEDLMPAAGPASGSSAARGGRYNEYGGSDLLDGLDHLGRLDIGFDGGTQLATDTVEPSPYSEVDHGVTVAPSTPGTDPDDPSIPVQGEDFPPTMPHDVLQVDESALDGGSGGGSATAAGSMRVSAPDGVAIITIGGVVVWQNGALTGNPVLTDEGHLDVTGFDGTNLTYTYTLTGSTQEHAKLNAGGENDAIAHEMAVVVTDRDGDSGSAVIRVEITDDVPTIKSFERDVTEGATAPVEGNALEGSAAGADGADFAWTNPTQQGQYGTITLNPNGSYSYTLDNNNAEVKALTDGQRLTEEFTYTYTDADGDVAEGKVTITINGVNNGVEVGSGTLTVYEAGLDDGSTPGGDNTPTTASGSLHINAPDGVATIAIGEVTVFENGALTGNTVSTDEGTLTVTGFDEATGELKFTYELTGNTLEHGLDGMDTHVSHDFAVTVTDVDGSRDTGEVTVVITDDGPMVTPVETEYNGKKYVNTVSVSFGADNDTGTGSSLAVNAYDDEGTAIAWTKVGGNTSSGTDLSKLSQGESWTNGNIIVSRENGNFVFKIKENGSNAHIRVTATDADGDTDTEELNLTAPDAGPNAIIVDEALLSDGSRVNSDDPDHAPSGTGSFTVNLNGEDGTVTLKYGSEQDAPTITLSLINGEDFTPKWLSTNKTLTVNGVEVEVKGATQTEPGGPWKIEYTYKLTGQQAHKNEGSAGAVGADDALSDSINITVTDATGDMTTGSLMVTVHDDGPAAAADNVTLTEAAAQAGGSGENVLTNDVFGADAPADKEVTSIEGGTLGQPVSGTYGELTLKADGSYSYKLNSGVDVPKGSTVTETFTYTITDADGDTSEATLTITIRGDESTPSISVPGAGDASATVYESGLNDGGSEASTDKETTSGGITLTLNGEAATVTIGGREFAVDADGNATIATGGESIDTGEGTLVITGIRGGKVSYTYTLKENQTHESIQGNNTLKDEIAISVTDATHDTASGTLVITIVDDVPTLTVKTPSVEDQELPEDNLGSGKDVDFVFEETATNTGNAGKEVQADILSQNNDAWNNVTIYAAHVNYEKLDDDGYAIDDTGIQKNENYSLEYSSYPNKDKNPADFGLMVRNEGMDFPQSQDGANGFETNAFVDANGNLTGSEAIVIDLGDKTAYGVSLDFGAFYSNFKGNEGQEHVLITFYKDNEPIGSRVIDAIQNEGGQAVVVHSDQFLSAGFDKVVISALQNTGGTGQASTFTLQGVGLITAPEPIRQVTGEITVASGADGYHAETGEDGTTTSNDFTQAHVRFDMPETLTIETEDGPVSVRLEVKTDSAGNSLLTGSNNGTEYFSVMLEQQRDGSWSWKMEQYQEFLVQGKDGQLGNLELGFITMDGDDDTATETVNIPLKNLPDLAVSQTTLVTDESYIDGLGSDTRPAEGGDGQADSAKASGTMSVKTYGKEGKLILTIGEEEHPFLLDTDGKLSESLELTVLTTYGQLTLQNGEAPGTIIYTYTQTKPYNHLSKDGPDQLAENAESFTVKVVDGGGNESGSATITVSIEDDAPMFSDESFTVDVANESEKYWSYGEKIEFTDTEASTLFEGKHIVKMQCEENTLSLYVGKIQFDANGNIDTSNNWNEFIDNQATFHINGEYKEHGIGVHSNYTGGIDFSNSYMWDNRKNEIGYDPISRQSEAVIIELDKPAVNMNIDLSLFFSAAGSDTNPEKAIFLFYKDGEYVGKSHLSSDEASGDVQQNGFSALPPGGFDTVVIAASDNGVDPNRSYDNSEFNISAITFNKFGGVDRTLTGQLDATSADGIKGYSVDTDKLATLELKSDGKPISYGWNEDTGRLLAKAGDATVFELVLNTETGAWTMVQYKEYEGELELPFTATDGDDDSTSISVEIPPTDAKSGTYKVTDSDAEKAVLAAAEQEMKSAVRSGEALATAAVLAGMATVLPDEVPAAEGDRPDTPDETLVAAPAEAADAPAALSFVEEGAALPDSPVDGMDDTPLLFANLALAGQEEPMVSAVQTDAADGPLWADASGTDDTSGTVVGETATAGPGAAHPGTAAPEAVLHGTDGDDILLGGDGDELIFGGSGDDFIDGGEGRDTIYAGDGNDIIVYDKADYLVSGGSGIDFMVSDDSELTLDTLLSGGKDGHEGPIVDSIEVLLKGEDALSLTSLDQLARDYGITLDSKDGKEVLQLDGRWEKQDDGSYDFNGGAEEGGLTLETNLQHDSDASSDNGEMAQQVFILEHTNS